MIVEVIEKCGESGGADESIFMIIFDSHMLSTPARQVVYVRRSFSASNATTSEVMQLKAV